MKFRIGSYNARGLRLGHSAGDMSRRLVVDKLLDNCDVMCIQETFLAKQDLEGLNTFHNGFYGAGESTTDLSTKIVRGRISGGVAILWNKNYDSLISVVRLGVDWAIGIEFNCQDTKFILLNIYTPYECLQNEAEFLNRLAFVGSFIQDNASTCIFVVGDMNADISDANSLFADHLMHFCADSGLMLSSKVILPNNSYTYISEAWHTSSWLDHCVCTADAHASLDSMTIHYDLAIADHIPFSLSLNVKNLPMLTTVVNNLNPGKLDWSKLTMEDLQKYYARTDGLLGNIALPKDAMSCRDINCKNLQHGKDLCGLYDSIVETLNIASRHFYKPQRKAYTIKPGWNEHVSELHAIARSAFKDWIESGRNRQGPLFEAKKRANANFKYALRYIKKNENSMRSDSLAYKLHNKCYNDFWKEVRGMNSNKVSLPANIEGVSGSDAICQMWRQYYQELFNCIGRNTFVVKKIEDDENVVINSEEVQSAILGLDNNKVCGTDKITAEHLKYASTKLVPLFAICLTGFLVHGILPESILPVLLVPVIKDKTGKINSMDNYRPIAIASIVSKVLERILFNRMEKYICTTDNQFGFKRQHGTDMCIFALKEILDHYNSQNSTTFMCFIDASKAFDRVNHAKLFSKLQHRGVPKVIIRILVFWYAHQSMQVKWGGLVSEPFTVGNGVRQGGILSPFLFNVYMDDLSQQLNKCNTGCMIGNTLTNHLMYADDLVIICPYSAGLQQLLKVCSQYGADFNIKYNASKSNVMIVRTKEDRNLVFPVFFLSGTALKVCEEIKYLGHHIANDLSDDKDINRQCRKIYGQANVLVRKFGMCSAYVKVALFKAFCTPLYTAHLWRSYSKKNMQRLIVAYNDGMRLLLKQPRWSSASQMFVNVGVPTCTALIRNFIFRYMCRISVSENRIIQALAHSNFSSVRFTSRLWRHWRTCLYIANER